MAYQQGKESFLKSFDINQLTPENFYNTSQTRGYPELILGQIPKISFLGGVVEDNFSTGGVNESMDLTKNLLHNVKNYLTACGPERIAEEIIDTCAECIQHQLWFNLIQVYDLTTLNVLREVFDRNYCKYVILKINCREQELLERCAKEMDIELASTAATDTFDDRVIIEATQKKEQKDRAWQTFMANISVGLTHSEDETTNMVDIQTIDQKKEELQQAA
jgi:hypothetical protein